MLLKLLGLYLAAAVFYLLRAAADLSETDTAVGGGPRPQRRTEKS